MRSWRREKMPKTERAATGRIIRRACHRKAGFRFRAADGGPIFVGYKIHGRSREVVTVLQNWEPEKIHPGGAFPGEFASVDRGVRVVTDGSLERDGGRERGRSGTGPQKCRAGSWLSKVPKPPYLCR